MQVINNKEDLLTVGEVARRLRVDGTTVRQWIRSGALDAVCLPHLGKRQTYRVRRTTIDTLLGNPQHEGQTVLS